MKTRRREKKREQAKQETIHAPAYGCMSSPPRAGRTTSTRQGWIDDEPDSLCIGRLRDGPRAPAPVRAAPGWRRRRPRRPHRPRHADHDDAGRRARAARRARPTPAAPAPAATPAPADQPDADAARRQRSPPAAARQRRRRPRADRAADCGSGSLITAKQAESLTASTSGAADEWKFDFHGYFRAPFRISFGPPTPVNLPTTHPGPGAPGGVPPIRPAPSRPSAERSGTARRACPATTTRTGTSPTPSTVRGRSSTSRTATRARWRPSSSTATRCRTAATATCRRSRGSTRRS